MTDENRELLLWWMLQELEHINRDLDAIEEQLNQVEADQSG